MIALHVFGPAFGLPDPSPFCLKGIFLMEMSGLPYRRVIGDMRRAPKGKLPVLQDGDLTIADSSFIRMHLEQKHGVDFDEGLDAAQRGHAWLVEKMLEDHLYWLIVQERWMGDANFDRGPRHFFKAVPAPLRPLVVAMVKRKVRRNLAGHGMGRYSADERLVLARRAAGSLSAVLGEKPYLTGDKPCGGDATLAAFLLSALTPVFDSPLRGEIESYPNLVTYAGRMRERYLDGARPGA